MNSVTVMISTYNGEKFLKEQIESILSQTNVKVKIFVRDDGSVDGTRNILNAPMSINGTSFSKHSF